MPSRLTSTGSASALPTSRRHVTAAAPARATAEAWRPAARAAGRDVLVDWRAGDVETYADRARLCQALGNLVGNALEHGTGTIEVRGVRSGDAVRLAVRDY